jgi:hypothetical protein
MKMATQVMIFKHAAAHLGAALLLFTLWAASDSWYLLTGLSVANALCVVLAVVTGALITTLVHEWAHLLGARLAGAAYRIPGKYGLFVYDFDFEKNNLRQFNAMSLAGQAGSWVTVFAFWSVLPMDTPGRVMLVGGAVASAIFAGLVELPVLKRVQSSGNPLAELSLIDTGVLRRSAAGGLAAGLLVWFFAA